MAFKVFTSTTLPASDVNDYLMEQSLIQCTSGTRPSSPAEGWHIWETDTDKCYLYNGSAWVEVWRTGAWTSYTYSPTNVSLSSTVAGSWVRLAGRTIHFWTTVTLPLTPSVSNPVGVSVPVTMSSTSAGIFNCYFLDNGTAYYNGFALPGTTSRIDVYAISTSGSYATYAGLSSTVPFTWAQNDVIYVSGTYEAAAST